MPEVHLPLPILGIDNVSDDTELPNGAVRVARNVDISRRGVVTTRPRESLAIHAPGVHSLYAGTHGAYAVHNAVIHRVDLAGSQLVPLQALPTNDAVSFADTPLGTAYVSPATTGLLTPTQAQPLTPPDGVAPVVQATSGNLPAGQYGVAISYILGAQEGALSASAYIDLADGQGIYMAHMARPDGADGVRIYRTEPNGSQYYLCGEFPLYATPTLLDTALGRPSDTRYLKRVPGGECIRMWNGRLLVCQGDTLYIGEPMRYGLYSPRFGFVQRPDKINLIAPTDGGLFIGTDHETVYLSGRSPAEWTLTHVDCGIAVPHSDTSVSLDAFNADWATTSDRAATWLTDRGYVVGLPSGQLISPQASRLRLARPGRATTAYYKRRLLTA